MWNKKVTDVPKVSEKWKQKYFNSRQSQGAHTWLLRKEKNSFSVGCFLTFYVIIKITWRIISFPSIYTHYGSIVINFEAQKLSPCRNNSSDA